MKSLIVSIGTCLLSCALFSCSENATYGFDENHHEGKCAKDVCSIHSNVHSGE